MKITPDTNVLLRAVARDDPAQSPAAEAILSSAELIAITLPALCEFVWVLRQGRKASAEFVARAIRELLSSTRVETNRPAIEAGLAVLEAGGDFADGVIAFEGRRLGADSFVTFDRDAARLLTKAGVAVSLMSTSAL